jgi:hypothetical protein
MPPAIPTAPNLYPAIHNPLLKIVVKSAALYRPATKNGSAWFILEKALLYDGHSF